MEASLTKIKVIPPDLRDLLKTLHGEIEIKLQHRRKVMLVDFINHINCLSRETYYQNKDLYSKLMIILNVAIKAGKFYFEDL